MMTTATPPSSSSGLTISEAHDGAEAAIHGHVIGPAEIEAEAHAAAKRRRESLTPWEIYVFAAICLADMVTTAYWYAHGIADEANPLLSFWIHKSVTAFCIAKLVSFVPLVIVSLVYHRTYRRFLTIALRIAILVYVSIYVIAVAGQLLGWFPQ